MTRYTNQAVQAELTAGDVEIGATEIKDASADIRAAVKAASGAVDTDNALVVADPNLDAKLPALGGAATAAAVPVSLASDDAHLGALGVASASDGALHAQLRYIAEALIGALGVGSYQTSLQSHFEATTSWVAEGDGTDNLATTTDHRGAGVNALSFDKVADAAATMAWISKTIASLDISAYSGHGQGSMFLYLSALTNVASAWVRIGTDASNYWQYTFADTELVTGWNHLHTEISSPTAQVGAGANLAAITYVAIGVTFDAAANTLAAIKTGSWELHRTVDSFPVGSPDVTVDVPFIALRDWNSNVRADVKVASGGTATDQALVVADGNLHDSLGAVGAAAASDGVLHAQLRYLCDSFLGLYVKVPNEAGQIFTAAALVDQLALTTASDMSVQLSNGSYLVSSDVDCYILQADNGAGGDLGTYADGHFLGAGEARWITVSGATNDYLAALVRAGTGLLTISGPF